MKFPVLLISSFLSAHAFAAALPAPATYKGVDISALVDIYRPQVKTLTKSIYTYNWSPAGLDPFWRQERSENDPALLNAAKRLAEGYWRVYGQPNGDFSVYGRGLYTAIDPVSSSSFSGGLYMKRWLLLEFEFPAGMQILTLEPDESLAPNDQVTAILTKFGCPGTNTSALFSDGGRALSAECRDLIKDVFQNILRVDALSYNYVGTSFHACTDSGSDYAGAPAFILTGTKWLRPGLIHSYTPTTKGNRDGRRRIQTLFLASGEGENRVQDLAKEPILHYLLDHPGSYVKSSSTKCDGSYCDLTLEMTDDQNKKGEVTILNMPRPAGPLITKAEAAALSSDVTQDLLWDDLDQTPKSPTISDWLKKNEFACDGQKPYAAQPKAVAP